MNTPQLFLLARTRAPRAAHPRRGRRATRHARVATLVISVLLIVPAWTHAACNLIPGASKTFNGAHGAATRPYAAGGERLELKMRPCDSAAGFGTTAADHVVSVLFEPPNGAEPTLIVLTGDATCAAIDTTECAVEVGSNAVCIPAANADLELVDRGGVPHLGFRFPDTDALIDASADNRTLAGPATVAVTAAGDPLPCGLAAGTCTGQAGVLACVDTFFANDVSCGTVNVNPIFPHFTALPPPNDYQADCVNEMPPCTDLETELRFALDSEGNVLLPIDWEGTLIRDGPVPVPRLMRGTLGLGFEVPGASFLASFTPEGGELAPIFEPQNDPTVPPGITSLFGSADAPYTILRFARRAAALTSCVGGAAADLPCNVDSECPSGSCDASTCNGGANDTGACTTDIDCPGGECGPSLFDFSPELIAGGAGPVILSRFGDGICQEDVALVCTVGTCASGPCVRYKMEALNPVPLEGLQVTDEARTFIVRENLDAVDRNGDGDASDSAVTFRDRLTGLSQPLGASGACMISGTPEGRAVIRVSEPPFTFPAVATEGPYLAFLESEGTTNVPGSSPPGMPCEQNGDHDRFDGIVRVFELGVSAEAQGGSSRGVLAELTGGFDLAVDADPRIDGRSIALSDGQVFFRSAEWMQGERTTIRGSVKSFFFEGGTSTSPSQSPAITPNGRFLAYASSAGDLVPGDTEGHDDIFLHDVLGGDTERVSLRNGMSSGGDGDSRTPALSADARFVAFASDATDLVSGDSNLLSDIFVHDRCVSHGIAVPQCLPSTVLVSVPDIDLDQEEDQADADCFDPAISGDGRQVAFRSSATALVDEDTNDAAQIFVHDLATSHTVVVSITDAGVPGSFDALGRPALSYDGRFVAFATHSFLESGEGGPGSNVYVHDRDYDGDGDFDDTDTGERDTETASVPTGGGFFGTEGEDAFGPSISSNGRFVAFSSDGDDLVENDTNGDDDVFVRDRLDDRTERVSMTSAGDEIDQDSFAAAISPDGRYVAFVTDADEVRADDFNELDDVYLHDRLTSITERISVTPYGDDTEGKAARPAVSSHARTVAFDSAASDILAPFTGVRHVYLRTNGPADPNDYLSFGADLFPDDELDDVVLQVFDIDDLEVTTLCPAGDTSVAAGHAAFLRPEADALFEGFRGKVFDEDCPPGALNGDGLIDDTVIHLWKGLFPVPSLGRGGTAVALAPDWLAALVSEPQDGVNYNGASGDTDMEDQVVQVHAVSAPAGTWVNVGQAADVIAIANTLVAFITPEFAQGPDGTSLNTENDDDDTADRVLQVYDADTASRTNVGVAAEEFVLGDFSPDTPCGPVQLVAARTPEKAERNTNLNAMSGGLPTGDTDTLDDVLHVYDAVSDELRNPGQAVTPCRIPECDSRTPYRVDGAKVTFLTLEAEQGGQDLNGDGTMNQLIIQVYDFCTDTVTVIGPVADDPLSDPLIIIEESGPFASPAGRCHLNIGCDPSTDLCGPGAFCEADTCDLDAGHCVVHQAIGCTDDTPCPQCVLREPAACLSDDDCPTDTTCEATIISVVTSTTDLDDDGVPDERDNCPTTPNTFQEDGDEDDVGDVCDGQTCGNGTTEPGETCDDGNTDDGDTCPANCTGSGCPAAPAVGCRTPVVSGRSSLTIDDRADDRRDRIRWRWSKGQATTKAEFGDPFVTDGYQLCLYDNGGLVAETTAPPGDVCNTRRPDACWHEKRRSFTYRDVDLTPAGVRTLVMTEGQDGRAKIDLRGRGPLFSMPNLAALASPVTVQLANSSGLCWEAVYSAPFRMQGPERFRARSD